MPDGVFIACNKASAATKVNPRMNLRKFAPGCPVDGQGPDIGQPCGDVYQGQARFTAGKVFS
ncbi:hypothetical protein CRBSH125_00490 [Afipia carboxidovorans]|nr:hypothetical protein CRBSH125_00490 [Afipia carboxidovorans]